jgi:hypothetical protein
MAPCWARRSSQRTRFGFAIAGACFILGLVPPAHATQIVWLDFDSGTQGNINYTSQLRDSIQTRLEADFAPFDYSFTQTQPVSGPFSTLFFNSGSTGGLSDAIDFRNLDPSDTAQINVDGWLVSPTSVEIIELSASIGAHVLGHLAGLRHGDSFGPIGSGIYSGLGASQYLPDYPGPELADETPDHIMASPASVGVPNDAFAENLFFSERSATKLAFNEQGSPIAEQGTAHGSIGTAQALGLSPLSVPNPLLSGDLAGLVFEVDAVAVTGSIPTTGELDYYSFSGSAGEILNLELMSNALNRIVDPLDPKVTVLDPNGALVSYYGSDAENDDGFETFDSTLIDLLLPFDGTYFIEVGASPLANSLQTRTGDYELFAYSFAAIPEPSTHLLLGFGLAGIAVMRRRSAKA